MNPSELWNRYRRGLIDLPELGFPARRQPHGAARGGPGRLAAAFERAFDAMDALEAGAIANPDENRMVGHYWLRAPELAPDTELAGAIGETFDRVAPLPPPCTTDRSSRPQAGVSSGCS